MKPLLGLLVFILIASHIALKPKAHDSAWEDPSPAQIQTLAASVKAEEVVMYSTSECPYCHAAKNWLTHNGFAFTECNMSVQPRCQSEFKAYGADGTPFLVIRRHGKEHRMHEGFDSDEFLKLLRS